MSTSLSFEPKTFGEPASAIIERNQHILEMVGIEPDPRAGHKGVPIEELKGWIGAMQACNPDADTPWNSIDSREDATKRLIASRLPWIYTFA